MFCGERWICFEKFTIRSNDPDSYLVVTTKMLVNCPSNRLIPHLHSPRPDLCFPCQDGKTSAFI